MNSYPTIKPGTPVISEGAFPRDGVVIDAPPGQSVAYFGNVWVNWSPTDDDQFDYLAHEESIRDLTIVSTSLGCPSCYGANLGTLEETVAVSYLEPPKVVDGKRRAEFTGETNYEGDLITVGICCLTCGWEERPDDTDMDSLLALLATGSLGLNREIA